MEAYDFSSLLKATYFEKFKAGLFLLQQKSGNVLEGHDILVIDIFHKLYNKSFKLDVGTKLRFGACVRYLVLYSVNILFPVYFRIYYWFFPDKLSLLCPDSPFIVSFTSFPKRMSRLHLVLFSLALQKVKPRKMILWLSRDQFPNGINQFKYLSFFQQLGLDVYFRDGDLRSYKKYCYLDEYNNADDFIIIDDDILYPSNTLSNLVTSNLQHPGSVCANRGHTLNGLKYANWHLITGQDSFQSHLFMPTGCGGVYYPRQTLHKDAFNKDLFLAYAPNTDDLWLFAMATRNHSQFVNTGMDNYFISLINKGNINLYSSNVAGGNNDKTIRKINSYFQHLGLQLPFSDI